MLLHLKNGKIDLSEIKTGLSKYIVNPPNNFILETTVKIKPETNKALSGLYVSNNIYTN